MVLRGGGRCAVAFAYGVAPAEDAGGGDDQEAGFDEELAAVEPINWTVFQGRVGEQAVPEEGGGSDVDREVEGFPKATAKTDAEVGRNDDGGNYVESDGADGVFKGLAGRVDGVEKIENTELGGLIEEKNDGMENGEGKGGVAGEVVQSEIIKVAMRPLAHRAVTEGH